MTNALRITSDTVAADGTVNVVVQNADQTRRYFLSTAYGSADTVQVTLTDDPARARIARSVRIIRHNDARQAAASLVRCYA